jgi:hypothetical protein
LLTGPQQIVMHGSRAPPSKRGQQLAERQRVVCPTPRGRRMCDRHGRGSVQAGAGVSSTQPSPHPGHKELQRSGMRFSGGGIAPAYGWDWDCRRDSLPPPPFTRHAPQSTMAISKASGATTRAGWTTSLVRALALHGVSLAGSHLGSPLRPGKPVLTLGVSRRRRVSGLCPYRSLT